MNTSINTQNAVKNLTGFDKTIANPREIKVLNKRINDSNFIIADMNALTSYQVRITELAIELNNRRWEPTLPKLLKDKCKVEFVDDTLELELLGINPKNYDLGEEIINILNTVTLCNFNDKELNSPEFKNLIKELKEIQYFY